ncbi:MAG: hypothetical protein IJ533_04980 [Prevotella sp.]|nr:hypothetical protein [Prevotella sp.]
MRNVKTCLLLLLLLFLNSVAGEAQLMRRHEFSASLGFGPNQADNEVKNVLDRHFVNRDWFLEDGCGDILGESFVSLNLEYYYRLNKQWAVGAMMGWGRASEGSYQYSGEEFAGVAMGEDLYSTRVYADMTSKFFYMAPSLRYAWFLRGNFRLYSRLAMGAIRQHTSFDVMRWHNGQEIRVTDASSDEVKWKPAYQLTPIGFDFGIEPIRVYSELGYGCQGIFTIGVRMAL